MTKSKEITFDGVGDVYDLELAYQPEITDRTNDLLENLELRDWLDSLAPKDGWIIWRRYWQGATSAEIGVELNSTVHWVNERHRILIERAQTTLGAS